MKKRAMSRWSCCECANGEYHGFPPGDEWMVGDIYFWCPIKKHHNHLRRICRHFKQGNPSFIADIVEVGTLEKASNEKSES